MMVNIGAFCKQFVKGLPRRIDPSISPEELIKIASTALEHGIPEEIEIRRDFPVGAQPSVTVSFTVTMPEGK